MEQPGAARTSGGPPESDLPIGASWPGADAPHLPRVAVRLAHHAAAGAIAVWAAVLLREGLARLSQPSAWAARIDPVLGALDYWRGPWMAAGLMLSGLLGLWAAWGVWAGARSARRVAYFLLATGAFLGTLWARSEGLGAVLAVACASGVALVAVGRSVKRADAVARAWWTSSKALETHGARIPIAAVAWTLITFGVLARLLASLGMDIASDGAIYVGMADGWHRTGELVMPQGESSTSHLLRDTPSHHFPPLYPVLLGTAYNLFGYGVAQTHAFALALSLVTLAGILACTWNLWGRLTALVVTAIVAVEPQLVVATGTNYSENLALFMFTITLWAIFRSLRRPWTMVWGGLAAGLAYLTRASLGALFVVAGFAGLTWRLLHRGRGAFNPGYLLGAALFGAIVSAWILRNLLEVGDWQTSAYNAFTTQYALAHPDLLAQAALWKGVYTILLFVVPFAALLAQPLGESLRRLRDESISGMWLAIALVLVFAWVMTSLFWPYEQAPMFWLDNRRYVLMAFIPVLWIAFAKPTWDGHTALRFLALAMLLVAATALAVTHPIDTVESDAAAALDGRLAPGDLLGVEGAINKYHAYPYYPERNISVAILHRDATGAVWGPPPDFVITKDWGPPPERSYPGMHRDGTWTKVDWLGRTTIAEVWVRDGR